MTDGMRDFQKRCERLVRNEVYYCMTSWVEFCSAALVNARAGQERALREQMPIDVDEIPAFRVCEECRGTGYQLVEDENQVEDSLIGYEYTQDDERELVAVFDGEACGECDDGEQMIEIFEWWAVSSWLADQLAARGYVILDNGLDRIWGRETTGQVTMIDAVIEDIQRQLDIKS